MLIRQAVRAASIIERLREFIRQRQPKPTPCEMTSLIKTAIDIVQPQLDEARVLIGCSKEVPSIVIDTDKTLLVQALVNLLRNAIDAVRDQPVDRRRISLCVIAGDSDEFIFSIADTGPGLSTEVKNKIFTPFFTTKADGLGLGLSICRSVAAAHGGNLWAENNPEGGVTFYLSLPRKSA